MAPIHRAAVAGLRLKPYSLSKRPSSRALVDSGRLSRPIGVNRGYWLLHEMQGPARNPERQADHHEKWPASDRGRLSGVRHQDLQDRRWEVVSFRPTAAAAGPNLGPVAYAPDARTPSGCIAARWACAE